MGVQIDVRTYVVSSLSASYLTLQHVQMLRDADDVPRGLVFENWSAKVDFFFALSREKSLHKILRLHTHVAACSFHV